MTYVSAICYRVGGHKVESHVIQNRLLLATVNMRKTAAVLFWEDVIT